MKESEAIELLKKANRDNDTVCILPKSDMGKCLIKALEKQIPKKPTPIDYEKYIDVIDNAKFLKGAFWCPNCKHVVKSGSFCKDCGQKLDWSDVE